MYFLLKKILNISAVILYRRHCIFLWKVMTMMQIILKTMVLRSSVGNNVTKCKFGTKIVAYGAGCRVSGSWYRKETEEKSLQVYRRQLNLILWNKNTYVKNNDFMWYREWKEREKQTPEEHSGETEIIYSVREAKTFQKWRCKVKEDRNMGQRKTRNHNSYFHVEKLYSMQEP